jgi:TolB-like protein/cytochrome c-type biogenesis protein CcmH/NrfG
MERRLAAILAADVAGYSRLTERDEAGTLEALKARRRNILAPLLTEHHGRIVKLMGDGVLVEFGSAVNAVRCAVDLQRRMDEANAGVAGDRRILLRIGINLGDVIVESGDLYGDGVNIAARLEAMAVPGGVYLSRTVVDHVRNKVELQFEDLGERKAKNLDHPVRVYRVAGMGGELAAPSAPDAESPAGPSIAVLPFVNLSGDAEQAYFSDGITEDILAGLSRFRQLFIIARNSSFQYRDQIVDVRQVARELGVRFVVEGSVRKAGTHLRVAVQLVEAATGNHLWAEKFDRELEDIFAVQDEITHSIVASIAGRVEEAERRRALRKGATDLTAYDLLLRGKHCIAQGSQQHVLEARALLERSLELDPGNGEACVALAITYFYEAISDWSPSPEAAAERLFELAQDAAQLDDQNSEAHLCLAWGYWRIKGNYEMAEAQIEEAIALNPNDLNNYCFKGWLSTCAGNLDEAIWCSSQAIRRAPNLPDECLRTRVMAEYLLGRFEQAILTFGRMVHPPVPLLGWVAACYAELGRTAEAYAAAADFRARARSTGIGPPDDDVASWRAYWAKCFPAREPASLERLFAGLRKAGLPV